MQQKSENQERVFEVLRVKMTEELNERKKASTGTGEGSFHSGVGMFLQCPLRL